MKIEIELSKEELQQLLNILDYTNYKTIEEYIYDSLNDLPKYSNFQEANNLLLISPKKEQL